MNTLGTGWVILHVVVAIAYVVVTANCFRTKKGNRFTSFAFAFFALTISSLITPFVVLAQPTIWPSLAPIAAIWWALLIYDGALASTLTPDNPGLIGYLLPFMAWLISWPIAALVFTDNSSLRTGLVIVGLVAAVVIWRERVAHTEFLKKYGTEGRDL